MKQIIITLLIASTAFTAIAQQPLTKEITVDKEIIPQEKEAQRLILTPTVIRPQLQSKKLNWSSRAVQIDPANELRILPPAPWEASISPQPYRGYVSGGYLPLLQGGLSAGYRIIDNNTTTANAALQYNAVSYKGSPHIIGSLKNSDLRYKYQKIALGFDITRNFGTNRTLSAYIGFTDAANSAPRWNYAITGKPLIVDPRYGFEHSHSTYNRLMTNAGIDWRHTLGSFYYSLGLKADYDCSLQGKSAERPNGFNDLYVDFSANVGYQLTDNSKIALDLSYSMANYTQSGYIMHSLNINSDDRIMLLLMGDYKKQDYSAVGATAYYNIDNEFYSLRIGAHLSSRSGDDKGLLVYPDLRLAIMPSQQFSAYIRVGGGDIVMNTLGSMWKKDPYISGFQHFAPSFQKWRGDAGLNIAPLAGLTVEFWGGYSRYGRIVLPQTEVFSNGVSLSPLHKQEYNDNASSYIYTGTYAPYKKYTSIHYGAAVGYKYGSVVDFRVSYEGAPDDDDKGYAQWLDRAKSEFKANVKVSPIKPLDVSLGFTMRNGRKTQIAITSTNQLLNHKLGNLQSLDLGACYRLNSRVSVWANLENILNKRWQICYGVMNPGITGLVGATYKF
ncbi:MAG: hypothetical protein NC343_00685 [Muribaculum sp.]|nr:hypothetical protein [Muribaculaceae bacterium]MCM1080251.1 hypothetical protein [Muribaculum sp.]